MLLQALCSRVSNPGRCATAPVTDKTGTNHDSKSMIFYKLLKRLKRILAHNLSRRLTYRHGPGVYSYIL